MPAGWRRSRLLLVVIDNYSVHKSYRAAGERRQLEAADVYFVYLSAYSSELSRIETHWRATKYYDLSQRCFTRLGDLKAAVETALIRRAINLRMRCESVNQLPLTPLDLRNSRRAGTTQAGF